MGEGAPVCARDPSRAILEVVGAVSHDQVAWFYNSTGSALSFRDRAGGYIDFTKAVYPGMSTTSLSWRISDHYPLWVEFGL